MFLEIFDFFGDSVYRFMHIVWMGRWKYRKHKIFLCFNRGHCFTYQNHSEQADYCRNNWWHKKLSLFSTKWSNKAWAIYPVSWWDIDCLKIGHYLAAVYEGQWYPSLILEINWDQRDLLVKSAWQWLWQKLLLLATQKWYMSCAIHLHYWTDWSAKYCQKIWTKHLQNQCKIIWTI